MEKYVSSSPEALIAIDSSNEQTAMEANPITTDSNIVYQS